jgi:hypothetical protein
MDGEIVVAQRSLAATEEKDLNTEVTKFLQRPQSLYSDSSSVISNAFLCALCVESFVREPGTSLGLLLEREKEPYL